MTTHTYVAGLLVALLVPGTAIAQPDLGGDVDVQIRDTDLPEQHIIDWKSTIVGDVNCHPRQSITVQLSGDGYVYLFCVHTSGQVGGQDLPRYQTQVGYYNVDGYASHTARYDGPPGRLACEAYGDVSCKLSSFSHI